MNVLRYAERPVQEIQEALKETKDAYKALVAKHDDYTMFLNDEEFDDAEAWLNECSSAIDTPGRNLNFVRNIKAQTTALNKAIT